MEQLKPLNRAMRLQEIYIYVLGLVYDRISDHLLGSNDVSCWFFVLNLSKFLGFRCQHLKLFLKLNSGWESEYNMKHPFVAEL